MFLLARFRRRFGRPRLMPPFFRLLEKLDRWHAVGFAVISLGVGQLLNPLAPLDHFLLYQVLFIAAVIIALSEIKSLIASVRAYREITASHPSFEAGVFLSRLLESNWSIPGLIVISSLYIYSTLSLGYIEFNPVGFYALVMISLVMVTAILGQTFYVYYLLFLRKVASGKQFRYNFYLPASTDWVRLLSDAGIRLSNAFFVLGFIYTVVFFLNMPDGFLEVSRNPLRVNVSTPNNFAFVVSWVTIFIIIIVAFPVYAWLRSRYIEAIIRRLKDLSIDEIHLAMREGDIRSEKGVEAELKFCQLMTNIDESADLAADRHNLLPIAATISSIAVHLIKIFESLPR